MNTSNTYLKFLNSEGGTELVSIDSIIDGGYPIDEETGDDMELVSDELVDYNGDPICSTDF